MDLEYVTKLIELVSSSMVDEIEIEEAGNKIRIVKKQQPSSNQQHFVQTVQPQQSNEAPPMHAQQQSAASAAAPPVSHAPAIKYHEVKSPIVGTFYRSPSPDAPSFVEVGSTIQKGGALCIIEAMKLMNEIESDVSGKIVEIMVKNGEPVEYDQVLFLVEPA